jgi:hypothetical protein
MLKETLIKPNANKWKEMIIDQYTSLNKNKHLYSPHYLMEDLWLDANQCLKSN